MAEKMFFFASSTTKGPCKDRNQNPGFSNLCNNSLSSGQPILQNFVHTRKPYILSESFDSGYFNTSPSFMNRLNDLEKKQEAGEKITKYVKASGPLWMQECERLMSEPNKMQVIKDCLKHQNIVVSVPTNKPSQNDGKEIPSESKKLRKRRIAKQR